MLFDRILFIKNLYFDNLVVNRDEFPLNHLLLEIVSIEGRTEQVNCVQFIRRER